LLYSWSAVASTAHCSCTNRTAQHQVKCLIVCYMPHLQLLKFPGLQKACTSTRATCSQHIECAQQNSLSSCLHLRCVMPVLKG
jgi:hypothetical protein